MNKLRIPFSLILFLTAFPHLAQEGPKYTVFLIGDAGEPEIKGSANIKLLEQQTLEAGENSAVIFLGDNIYPAGLPPQDHKGREDAETAIEGQMEALKAYRGQVFFVPGNHDWQKGKADGYQYILNQEKYVEDYLEKGNAFIPDYGCPGPEVFYLTNNLVLIIYDSQWLRHKHFKPGMDSGCRYNAREEVLAGIAGVLEDNIGNNILLVAHHPMLTYGIHGGKSTFREHIFPLTEIKKWLYLPLPGLGSIYPLYRKKGSIQDINHPVSREIRTFLMNEFKKYPGLIHAAGHEHSLQYITRDENHYIVSGAGSKTTPVKKKEYAKFAESHVGFAKLKFYTDHVQLEFWKPVKGSNAGEIAFSTQLPLKTANSTSDF